MIKYIRDILVYQACKKLDIYNDQELEEIKKITNKRHGSNL